MVQKYVSLHDFMFCNDLKIRFLICEYSLKTILYFLHIYSDQSLFKYAIILYIYLSIYSWILN